MNRRHVFQEALVVAIKRRLAKLFGADLGYGLQEVVTHLESIEVFGRERLLPNGLALLLQQQLRPSKAIGAQLELEFGTYYYLLHF